MGLVGFVCLVVCFGVGCCGSFVVWVGLFLWCGWVDWLLWCFVCLVVVLCDFICRYYMLFVFGCDWWFWVGCLCLGFGLVVLNGVWVCLMLFACVLGI